MSACQHADIFYFPKMQNWLNKSTFAIWHKICNGACRQINLNV